MTQQDHSKRASSIAATASQAPAQTSRASFGRRAFLGGSATAALGALALLSGCGQGKAPTDSKAVSAGAGAAAGEGASFLSAPEPIADSKITNTKDAEIVVVGCGVSGMCAARAALDAGAQKIIVIEKAATWQYRSNQVGTIGGVTQRTHGISIDKNELVGELMRECGYRPNQRLLNYWADHSGEAFDWFLQPVEGKYVIEDASKVDFDKDGISIRQMHYPQPEQAKVEQNYYKIYPTCQIILPDLSAILKPMFEQLSQNSNIEFIFEQRAVQLVRPEGGRVEAVVAEDLDGGYHRYNASKAVILATGDYSGNKEMMHHYVPWAEHFGNIFPNQDAWGKPTNTGDGQQMGMWIGGKMEIGPHAPMTHHLGGPVGVDGFLQVDIDGERFMNEDVGGQPVQNQLSRVKGGKSWQIFDDNFREQLEYMDGGHGNVSHFVSNDQVPQGEYGRNTYVSQEMFDKEITVVAQTIEELAEKTGLPLETLKKTIDRYNELAEKGVDEDFGKRADRLFPIVKAPFYAYEFKDTVLLVTMGGLVTDEEGRLLDENSQVIEGVYATGNTMGNRFVVDYPLPAPGISHGMAITFGRMVGTNAVTL